ncbi:phage portal protein [Paenibacillus sp. MSJ-34]|uniref:phage portal protein n=1 Tax=Paenibacillus sp. MSJ-34 TaxID=2841529 RepID=UPI001C103B34|nr:phage portal protein [Paenibacillus sp. MSJ-34]MBU5441219.1 phage portal protein [Paenibacillus sp. MSJ-34]
MGLKRWMKQAVGEISKLRRKVSAMVSGFSHYSLDSRRVDYELARNLYDNAEDSYKLGAGFCKPIINAKAGFIGVPSFLSDDENARKVINDFFAAQTSKMTRTHKKALLEGDCFVWLTREAVDAPLYPEVKARIVYTIIPNEEVASINRNPLTGQVEEYVLKSTLNWMDERGEKRVTKVTQWISAQRRKIVLDGDPIPGVPRVTEEQNPWGFIPIEHFQNERDETRIYGQSELEPLEPFIKAYHDVMLHALQGSKMHSTPRLKLKLKDVAAFLRNNFNVQDPAQFAKDGGTISLDGRDFLIFTDSEDAEFIEVRSSIGDATSLLKLLFYCIVSVSETPEFVLGVHTPSSLASTKEQMPVFVRMISRKRGNFTENWQRLARMVLAMTSQAEMTSFETYATTLEWDEIDPRDEKELAETIQALTAGLNTAVQGGFISCDSAADFLRAYVPTMKEYDSEDPEADTEWKRIVQNKIDAERLADGALSIRELKRIDKELQRMDAS